MKPRNREINIFNLSMMDVISGAMGAFLVLVVLLSRHYDPDPPTTEKIVRLQKELVEATGQIDDASHKIHGGSRDTDDIVRALQQAKGNVDAARATVAALRDDLATAKARIRLLEEEAEKMEADLARRTSFLFLASWACDGNSDVDVYMDSSFKSVKGDPDPEFDPGRKQSNFFADSKYVDELNRLTGTDIWLWENTTLGDEIKIYYRLAGDKRTECAVRGRVVRTGRRSMQLPLVRLNAQEPWMLFGTLKINDESKFKFEVASGRERQIERRRLGAGD